MRNESIRFATINKIQIEFEPDLWLLIDLEMTKCWLPRSNLSFNDHISLKFIWYVTIKKYRLASRGEVMCQLGLYVWLLKDIDVKNGKNLVSIYAANVYKLLINFSAPSFMQ